MQFTAREIMLAIAITATLVGAFLNCKVVAKALRAWPQFRLQSRGRVAVSLLSWRAIHSLIKRRCGVKLGTSPGRLLVGLLKSIWRAKQTTETWQRLLSALRTS